MRASDTGVPNGTMASTRLRDGASPDAESPDPQCLQRTCRRQADVITTMGEAISAFSAGAKALKAENAQLRAEHDQMRRELRVRSTPREGATSGRVKGLSLEDAMRPWDDGAWFPDVGCRAVRLPLNARAPTAARALVGELADRVSTAVLDDARLLVSELVTNSLRHSGASPDDTLVLRTYVSDTMLRVEVEDPGCAGAVAMRSPDHDSGGGFGLNLVQTLSERWGTERAAAGGTRVWAQLSLTPSTTAVIAA